jgi:hypothetical protein
MHWYCALTDHLLDKNKIAIGVESFALVLKRLEDTVIKLYEELLQY